jgi:GT2 family glycosyltransferase
VAKDTLLTPPPFQFAEAPSLDLSIVIVNFNTREIVLDCLRSIQSHTRDITFEILVVDNNSEDGSGKAIKKSFPQVVLIENKDNRGFSAANNQGLRISKGRYAVLLNSDTALVENCFAAIVRYLDAHPEFSILGPEILDSNNQPCSMRLWEDTAYDAAIKILGRFDAASEFRKMGSRETKEVEVVGGSCFVIRREMFATVGLLDENYFLYNEEDDFCRRARRLGKKVCYFPEARLQHLLGQSTHQPAIREKVIRETYKSNLYFYSKHYSVPWNLLLRSLYCLTFASGILRSLWKIMTGKTPLGVEDSISLKLKLLFMKMPKLGKS